MKKSEADEIAKRNEVDEIELRSEELQQVLGKVPPWILRRGLTLLAVIVALLLAGSAIFKYPDVVQTGMVLTGSIPPAEVVAQVSGRMDSLYVKDNQSVDKNSVLAVLHNTAKTEDIRYLGDYLNRLNPDEPYELPVKELKLGVLQMSYASLYSALFDYREFLRLDYHPGKTKFINERIGQLENLYSGMLTQREIVKEQLNISYRQYRRDSILHAGSVLSGEELERSRNTYLQGRLSFENINRTAGDMRLQITQLREASFENTYQFTEQGNTLRARLESQVDLLGSEIKSWELTYQLTSPIDGRITFTNYWTKNQNVNAGAVVFTIIPTLDSELVGKATLPVAGAGKVAIGQRVNIRFDNFPDAEFGVVAGEVRNISLVPVNSDTGVAYTVEIALPNGLMTSYNKELPFMPNMVGRADIITKDISLLARFFMPLKKIVTEGLGGV